MIAARNNAWKVNKALEATKLSSSQAGWNLAGGDSATTATRTRHGGNGRPDLCAAAQRLSFHFGSDTDSSYSFCDDDSGDDEQSVGSAVVAAVTEEKPACKRAILEIDALQKIFEKHSTCPMCKKKLSLQVDSVCLVSSVSAACGTRGCGYVSHGDPAARANIQTRNFPFDARERTTDFAINIIYVLGIISVGDGSVEAGRFCGLLSLPRDTSMERRSFPVIEERIGPAMRELQDEILDENLTEEVRCANAKSNVHDENDFMLLWQQSIDKKTVPLFDLHMNFVNQFSANSKLWGSKF